MAVRIKENQIKRELYKRNITASKNIRTLRLLCGCTQQEVANKLSIGRTAYYALETGARQPDYETLLILSEFYNVNMDYIISYDICDQMLNMFRVDTNEINAARFMIRYFSLSHKGKEEIKTAVKRMLEYEKKFNSFPWHYEGHEEMFFTKEQATR